MAMTGLSPKNSLRRTMICVVSFGSEGFRGLLVEINRQDIGELDFFRMAAVFNNMLAGDVVG